MNSLRQALEQSSKKRVAIGHFNFSDLVTLRAIFDTAQVLQVPVLVGVSEGERKLVGVKRAAALVRSIRDELAMPIFLNADHTESLEHVREAAVAGFDEVMFDGSKLPFDENVKQTRQAVEIAKSINPDVIVEGEIGYIGSGSEIIEKRPDASLKYTEPEEARQFAQETKIDVLAPAVGNMHGMMREMISGEAHKQLDIPRIGRIKQAVQQFMTLHGGSGTSDEHFAAAIKNGMNIVHVNTELRIAWRHGFEEGLKNNPNDVAPSKILPTVYEKIAAVVRKRMTLFNS